MEPGHQKRFDGAEVTCPPESSATRWILQNARETVAAWKTLVGGEGGPQHYPAGGEIFRKGQEARDVYLIAEGLILLYCDLPSGHESEAFRNQIGRAHV